MDIKYLEIVETIAEYEVECAKAQFMFEAQTGLKLDKMTDFLTKFIYLEDLKERSVTMTILANTLMVNENTIRSKLKQLMKHNLIEMCKCGCDGRTKKILPTNILKRLMIVDATTKLKTVEHISKPFREAFGDMFADFYKEFGLAEHPSFPEHDNYDFYADDYKHLKDIYKNTNKKLA
jgi:hypothetical protein|tara:strand:+ start:719 stop:1252 length:534 start_codon:yes stop_codon:yes gene_type:complete